MKKMNYENQLPVFWPPGMRMGPGREHILRGKARYDWPPH